MSATSDAFLDAAHSALSFLEHDYGFSLTEKQAPETYEWTSQVYTITYRKLTADRRSQHVTLSTAPARCELDIDLGYDLVHGAISGNFYGGVVILRMTVDELHELESGSPRPSFECGVYAAFGDRDKMSVQYGLLASILKDFGSRFFQGDPSLATDVDQLRNEKQERRERERTARDAERAFKMRDWIRAIRLLESLGMELTPLQQLRLKYARKQAGCGT